MSNPWAIEASNITVEYRSPKYKYTTFKEYVINALKGKKGYTRHKALDKVSIRVAKGEAVALIGHNGSGKSTLLRVLAGIIEPEGAIVKTQGRIAPMIELGAGFDHELSGTENIYLSCTLMGLSEAEITERLPEIVRFAELEEFIDMPFKNFSSGMQARLGFACATAVDPDIILADEVLAVGDSNFAKKCLLKIDALRQKGAALILVSHDPGAVAAFCGRAYVFNKGRQVYEGTSEEALKVHDQVMEARYYNSLMFESKQVQKEEALEATSKQVKPPPLPDFSIISAGFFQKGEMSKLIEPTLPFQLKFHISLSDIALILDHMTIGFALVNQSGFRLFGGNNTNYGKTIEFPTKGKSEVTAEFDFPEGLPDLATNTYHLVLGVHDSNLSRTIFCEIISSVKFSNAKDSINKDTDTLHVKDRTDFKLYFN